VRPVRRRRVMVEEHCGAQDEGSRAEEVDSRPEACASRTASTRSGGAAASTSPSAGTRTVSAPASRSRSCSGWTARPGPARAGPQTRTSYHLHVPPCGVVPTSSAMASSTCRSWPVTASATGPCPQRYGAGRSSHCPSVSGSPTLGAQRSRGVRVRAGQALVRGDRTHRTLRGRRAAPAWAPDDRSGVCCPASCGRCRQVRTSSRSARRRVGPGPVDGSSAAGAAASSPARAPLLQPGARSWEAALRAGIPYVDVAAEMQAVADLYADVGDEACAARRAVMPAMALFGGLWRPTRAGCPVRPGQTWAVGGTPGSSSALVRAATLDVPRTGTYCSSPPRGTEHQQSWRADRRPRWRR